MKKEKAAGAVFLFVIFLMLALVVFGTVVRLTEKVAESKSAWDSLAAYPFRETEETAEEAAAEKSAGIFMRGLEKIWSVEDIILSLEEKIENRVTDNFQYRMPFVLAKRYSDKLLGLDMTASLTGGANDLTSVEDVVVPFTNGILGWVFDDVDITENVDSLIQFGLEMETQGRNFLFFENPDKYAYTAGFADYSAEKELELWEAFQRSGLNMITSEEIYQNYPYDLEEMYYKTDHHWTAKSGIWADGLLCAYLNEHFGYDFDTSYFDIENYKVTVTEDVWFGSSGKKVTGVYTEAEKFEIYTPLYNTNLDVFLSVTGESATGTIQETLLDYTVLDEKDLYSRNYYSLYGYGSQGLVQIHNNDISDGSNILLVKASFANCMYPFLSAVVEDLNVIDLRHFDGSLETFIEETNPDTVIVEYGLSAFANVGVGWDGALDFR